MRSYTRETGADRAHAAYAAAHREFLASISEVDRTDAWKGDGAGNLPSWLAARYQVSCRTAREWVEDAKKLAQLPDLDEAYAKGEVSCDQMKAVATLSRPGQGDDGVRVETLWGWSIAELQSEARRAVARECERRDGGVYLRMEPTPDERFMRVGRLHPEDGAALLSAVEAPGFPKGTPLRDWDRASAKALVELATGGAAPRATVLLSVSGASLAGEP